METQKTYNLDPHCLSILEEYREKKPQYERLVEEVAGRIKARLAAAGIVVAAVEYRVKAEASLAGKLKLKGAKYASLSDITDIIGLRVITFYIDDVDKVASIVDRLFDVDWENSVDKRRAHEIDSFGYLSLHYICSMSEAACTQAGLPGMDKVRFEVQMRTVLQHAWANMDHDTGYKSAVEVPRIYHRKLSRLAGILELVDEQFSQMRTEINDYRRQVQALVASGNLDELKLDGESFKSFLALDPFGVLNRRIASVNQAEIQEAPMTPFLVQFRQMGFETLGDVEKLIRNYSEAAFQIACFQISITDLDIIASTVGPQNLCVAYIAKNGGGVPGLKQMLDTLNGPSEVNLMMAEMLYDQVKDLAFMHSKQ